MMPSTNSSHTRRRRVAAVLFIAAVVPVAWLLTYSGFDPGWRGNDLLYLVAPVVLVSTLLWGGFARALLDDHFSRPLPTALVFGLLSPVLAGLLIVLVVSSLPKSVRSV